MTTLCLVRHGETAWNVEGRLQGHLDIPLNAQGEDQARRLARELAGEAFDLIVSSPLQRALATAQAVAQGRSIRLDPRLRERQFGALQGLTRAEIAARHPEIGARLAARRPDFLPPGGGESVPEFAARVAAALDDLRDAGRVLVVAHGGVLDVVWRIASGQPFDSPRTHALPNAALNWFSTRPEGGWRCDAFGLDTHLQAARDDTG